MKNHKDKLRIYIEEQRNRNFPDVRERGIELNLNVDLITDIIGPRRAGKTSLMYLAMKELLSRGIDRKFLIYINFENRRLLPLNPDCFNDLIEIIYEEDLLSSRKLYVFLDEVQRVSEWEKYVRSIYDEFKGKLKILVSGSTSKLTRSNLSHLLTGRHLTTYVFPLSFDEVLNFKGIDYAGVITEEKKAKIDGGLRDYLKVGGFPEVVLTKNEEILETLFLDIINRDISPNVRKRDLMEEIAYFLCSQIACHVSFSKLSRILKNKGVKVSVPTLEKYFYLMKDTFLFFDNKIFSYKVKDQLQYPKKIYCVDNGFVNYFGFKFTEDLGRLMENTVFIRLLKDSLRDRKKNIFYYKSHQGYEVDFVVKEGLKVKQLIQVCYDISDEKTRDREIRGLIHGSKDLKCKDLIMITYDYEGIEDISWHGIMGKINFIPLWKWLLEK